MMSKTPKLEDLKIKEEPEDFDTTTFDSDHNNNNHPIIQLEFFEENIKIEENINAVENIKDEESEEQLVNQGILPYLSKIQRV